MGDDLNRVCLVHSNREDCPDSFIAEMNGGYGLMIHDGGSSAVEIAFCPWCGAALATMDR